MGFSLIVESGSWSLVVAHRILIAVASFLGSTNSRAPRSVVGGLGLYSTGSAVWHTGLVALWHVGSSQIKPVSAPLAGRFFTAEPPWSPSAVLLRSFKWLKRPMQVFLGNLSYLNGASSQKPACQCRRRKRHGFHLWVRRRAWQPILLFLGTPWWIQL